MKLIKPIQLDSGTTIPAGTELNFSSEGVGYFKGEKLDKTKIPVVALEAGKIAVYNAQQFLGPRISGYKNLEGIQPWENCYMTYTKDGKVFIDTFTWDTKIHIRTVEVTPVRIDHHKVQPVDWLDKPVDGSTYNGHAGDPGQMTKVIRKAIRDATKKYRCDAGKLNEMSIFEFVPKDLLPLFHPYTWEVELERLTLADMKRTRGRGFNGPGALFDRDYIIESLTKLYF